MISVIYCTRVTNKAHTEHLRRSSGMAKNIEIIEVINNGESLTVAYNRALKQTSHDIVVFCHDDLTIETKSWGHKLIKQFNRNPEFGIIGVAGSKHLPITGRWWDDKKKMYGRVKHTNDGKSWLSAYSPDQGHRLEEVVNVDGVFFAIHRDRIKTYFDESVEGFHFYDVDFSFNNHMAGCKVGVTTIIRINHQSIGVTNDEWEDNRKIFAEKYKDKLPVKIDETYEYRKLKVLIGCLNFQGLTGSEISTLETAKALTNINCDVHVISSTVSPKFASICKRYGIKTYLFTEPPSYKLGDGKWSVNTPQGVQQSKEGTLYFTNQIQFDVIHTNHTPITEQLLKLYPNNTFVNIVRSEVIDLENPVINDKIKKYVAIRPSIKTYLMDTYGIEDEKIEVIYNPFDKTRFKPKTIPNGTDKKVTLFVGTMDYLREEAIRDLIEGCEELWLVGKDSGDYAAKMGEEYDNVTYFPPTDNIEEFFYKCDETAGIFLGRTTIEGFLCDKPAIIYNVNKYGNVIDKELVQVPEDMSIFDIDNIIAKYKKLYIEVANA